MSKKILQHLFGAITVFALLGASVGTSIADDDRIVHVDIRKGQVIRLSRPASSVFVADPEVADVEIKSPQFLYVLGKRAGETSLLVIDDKDEAIYSATISVTHNLRRLTSAITQLMPEEEVTVTSLDRAVILSGRVSSPRQAEDVRRLASTFIGEKADLINRLQITGPTQVNLRVRIAEVSREVSKEIGFNWEAIVNNVASGDAFLFGFGNVFQASEGFAFGNLNTGNLDMNVLLDALEEEGLITTLAEPNLTAMSGETANFLAGGEFPVPVPDEDGIAIIFKEFGVSLAFTPSILDKGTINLRVAPEVSQLSESGAIVFAGLSIPALTTRRAETTVELASGQSLVIAGLLQNNTIRGLQKFPGLGDIPILGALFTSDRFIREETELVIVVTPYLVKPVADRQIALPTDGYNVPSDLERLFKGSPYKQQPIESSSAPRGSNSGDLAGPAGFTLN